MKGMGMIHTIAFVLVIIGGVNWLVYALAGRDVLSYIPGVTMDGTVATVVYVLVGISAIYLAIGHRGDCRTCGRGMM